MRHKSQRRNSGKVTLIELLWVTLLIGGVFVGVIVGSACCGSWGGMLGLPLGIAGGLLVSWLIAHLLNRLFATKRPRTDKPSRD
jgi:hypothetical protein